MVIEPVEGTLLGDLQLLFAKHKVNKLIAHNKYDEYGEWTIIHFVGENEHVIWDKNVKRMVSYAE